MTLNWQQHQDQHPFLTTEGMQGHRYLAAESAVTLEDDVKDVVEAALEQAEALLDSNVANSSLFFLATWDKDGSVLTLSVTDATKKEDAPDLVTCRFTVLSEQLSADAGAYDDLSAKLQFWIKDYLSTSTRFMNYSLVAVFTDSGRDRCQIV